MRTVVGLLVGAIFVAAVVFGALRQGSVECEVCVRFEGREACNTSAAPDRDTAIAQATSSACSRVSGGVTQGMRCDATPPARVRCVP